ncbi:atypical kinase COQ8B, mitochondrial [Drosophila elegans]|uniref:atypical kinase COQ8B, mitochondrial n=1 Tax=Drosophila elegans TaxID=30023 RepID=UPI0007E5E380|nr:atypical kinase COQ8B, mitochondrial [Drosophila elegans]
MSRSAQEMLALLRGLQIVMEACGREHLAHGRHLWSNSSIRELIATNAEHTAQLVRKSGQNPTEELRKLQLALQETGERGYVVAKGICSLLDAKVKQSREESGSLEASASATANVTNRKKPPTTVHNPSNWDAANLDISSITLQEFEEILSRRNKDRSVSLRTPATKSSQTKMAQGPADAGIITQDTEYVNNVLRFVAGAKAKEQSQPQTDTQAKQEPIDVPALSQVAKQRKVPSSRIGRMASFGGLFAGLGVGTLSELTKGALGLGGSTTMREALLSPANAERIVDTLCKVRGAALKIGQILSIQDSSVVSPQLAKAFERVRQAADYMPDWQVERVMNTQLGADWRQRLSHFEAKPFAAASIGQVHRAKLLDGMDVAIKIQYPGVAQSIESDIDNLVGMLKVWDVFPQGFFIDNVVRVAKRELQWEVDYDREAEYTEKFREMIAPYPEYYVPRVVRDLTTSSVLTTELVPGLPLDKCFDLSYEHRAHIAASVLKLCLRELFEIECMQTDPNWSNFLYDAPSRRLMLIDFGSTRFYRHEFIRNYRQVIMSAAEDNRQGVLEMSRQMGFLTGYETKQMEQAHVDAVMILGEIFRYDGEFDFGKQNTTERLAALVPTMVAHRLCPPPEEIYSIHRKLSGIFLLCARLNVRMNCVPFYKDIVLGKFKD